MNQQLKEMLHLALEPVGIYFGNTSAKCDFEASPDQRNCLLPLLLASAKGKVISLNEESCTCPGGAVGACFGDGFTRMNPNIHKMLSQGLGDLAPADAPPMVKEGERFFCTEDLGMKWRRNIPYSERAYPRIVFGPLSQWTELGTPDLVYVFANPDQISALVTLLGFHNGDTVNTIVPYGAACQSIVYAADQIGKDKPFAVMGLFDLSQRSTSIKDYLSLTMPFCLWENMTKDLDKNCLTTHSWKNIEKRL